MDIIDNEKINLTEEEILDTLQSKLVKGESVNKLCEELNISEFDLYGYIKKLKDIGLNITFMDKKKDVFLSINNHPDFSKEYTYKINEDYDSKTKIGVISNLGFGSKYEQIALLNDAYKKFASSGVKYVIVAGNLVEGKYTSNDEKLYGNSLIYNDAYGQADHLIDYYPHVEGIQTLFITGYHDHSWSKDLNIGQYIESKRNDMKYIGPKSCTIEFNNVKVKVENLKKNGEAYTIAYPPQKYSRSMSSYEDYDLILLGGTLTAQEFPQIRDTRIIAVPSLVDRTPKMRAASQSNTMGSYEIELEYNKTGKLKRMVSTLSPYYLPSNDNYLKIKPLDITNDEANIIVKETNKSDLFHRLDKIYRLMKKEESFEKLRERLNLSSNELFGLIDMLSEYGREIEVVDINNELVVRKFMQRAKHLEIKPPKEELHKKEFGVISDTHYGSIWSQPSMVNTFVYEGYNRGIDLYFHVGDITDGDYHTIRPDYLKHVFIYGATGFADYVAKTLPKYPGIKYKGICGSHDESLSFNYPPFDFGPELEKRRPDFEYLGQDYGYYYFDKCKIELFHPGGGTSRILSTKPQNGIDQLASRTKPNLSLRGHYHKVYYMLYRNVHTLLCPCNVDQSLFMRKNEIPNLMGDYFVTIWYDDSGSIQYIETEPMLFTQDDVRKNDYENPKRCLKHKSLTKR